MTCVEKHYPLIRLSFSFLLLTLTVSLSDDLVSLRKFISTEVRRRHGVEFFVGGVEFFVVSRFPLSLPPPGSSWISGRDPLLVVASCNSPEIHPNLNFRFLRCCAIV